MTLAIYCPTYRRPWALQAVADNLAATTATDYTLYFGLETGDTEGIAAAKATGATVVINSGSPGYADTIQSIYEVAPEPLILHANDDFEFLPGWDVVPVAMFDSDWVQVVGVKQNEADQSMSAVCLFRRKYIEERSGVVDMPGRVFYPYNHNYVDTEFTLTARSRGVWAACDKPCINHQHPILTGTGEKDETYKKNDATVHLDEATFNARKHLFT